MLGTSTTHGAQGCPGHRDGQGGPTPAEKPAGRRVGAYVHFPWCLAKCPYCDFVSFVTPAARPAGNEARGDAAGAGQARDLLGAGQVRDAEGVDHAGYADAVLREIDARASLLEASAGAARPGHGEGRRLESIFFGGGTPSLWAARELGRVLARVRAAFADAGCVAGDLEVTVECNPTSLDEARARALADVGVTRVSIGVQSLRDERLRFLGRLHDAKGALAAIGGAQRAGALRVSADLIFGLPGQSPEEARAEALELVGLGLSHVSCYQLTIESGTRFGELARRGRLPLADEGAVAESFLAIDEALTAAGFLHYEVSNYARPGQQARHNLGYWRGDDYWGLGCAAYGCATSHAEGAPARGERWRNLPFPDRYVEATTRLARAERLGAVQESVEPLDAETLLRERLMLGLRIADGIDVARAGRDLGIPGWTVEREKAAKRLAERGRVVREGDVLRVPRDAWLWTDDTAARLF
jgi:putative oxygen-independent coproporphyrinogen III oxidase